VFKLSNETYDPNNFKYAYNELSQSFLQEKNTERVLDVIELSARVIDR
jgi:hypothetical protein